MGNRCFTQVSISDDEGNASPQPRNLSSEKNVNKRKRKKVHLSDDEKEEKMEKQKLSTQKRMKDDEEMEENKDNEEEDAEAQPTGEVVRVSGKGRGRRSHFSSFEYDDVGYQLEDPVLLVPEGENQKPYVAIIKDIAQTREGAIMVTGQWFYRPEEAEKTGGGNWQSRDTRELFYSFHRDEVAAESVMHKCMVHFIPLNKQIPHRKQHPGFIVQRVYDIEQRRLFKLTDKDYEDKKQHEVNLLVQKTLARLGDLPDLEPENKSIDPEDQMKNKRLAKRKNVSPLDVSKDDEGLGISQPLRAETPGSTSAISSEYYAILLKFKKLTGENQRDRWLEKLLQSIQFICIPVGNEQNDDKERGGPDARSLTNKNGHINQTIGSPDKISNGDASFYWPDAAVHAIVALEKAAHESLSADFQKYNQKMRQLVFNLKSNAILARRFLNKELEPAKILNMSPNELKEGLTAEEIVSQEPEESGHMQMTDARCRRCSEKQVGLIDIIQAGRGDRYQLECVACGNTWYASRDEASTLTIEGPSLAKTVGTEPLATAKFEDVEKILLSPLGEANAAEKGANEVLKKTTEAYVLVLEKQRSLNNFRVKQNLTIHK